MLHKKKTNMIETSNGQRCIPSHWHYSKSTALCQEKKKKKTQEDSSKNGIMQLLQDQSGTICYIPLWLLLLTAEGKKKTRRCHEHGASGKTGALYHNGGRISRCSLCWVYKLSTLKQTRNNSLVSKASTETSVPLSANYAYRLSKSHRRNFHQCKMCR